MTLDQRDSRTSDDRVPGLLDALGPIVTVRAFERTIGDEIQGVLDDAAQVAEAVRLAAVLAGWHIGIGIGGVEAPLPSSPAAGRGEAFYAARSAVEAAKTAPAHLVVEYSDADSTNEGPVQGRTASGDSAVDGSEHAGYAEAALRLLVRSLEDLRVSSRRYVAHRLDHPDATQAEIAEVFGVSQQAVSRVLSQGSVDIIAGARALSSYHLQAAAPDGTNGDGGPEGDDGKGGRNVV